MKSGLKFFVIFLIAGAMLLYSGISFSADNNIDVVLVMDSSGSMKNTDPQSLRIPAAKLFISLLKEKDRASVVSFSDKGYQLIDLTPVNSDENRANLLRAADRISSNGLYTNLFQALSTGFEILSEDTEPERSRFIILMSDGMMDVGDPEEDRRLLEKMKNELAPLLEDNEVKVYAIAFTEQSARELLEKISKRTGGFYNLALSDREFHLIFTSIFENLKSPEMLPMTANGFVVDGSIEEVTIVATKGSAETKIELRDPDGQSFSRQEQSTGVAWFESSTFDMITVEKPLTGNWEILFSSGENNKAYIMTNLKLKTNFEQLYATFGDPLDINIWLEKDGAAIEEQHVLDTINVYIEMTDPGGGITKLTPFVRESGIFNRKIAPFTPGNYTIRIVAQGKTFEREKNYVFNVADARESKVDILAEREKKKQIEKRDRQNSENNDTDAEIPWKKIIIQFVSFNAVLALIIVLYFKRKGIMGVLRLGSFFSIIGRKGLTGKRETAEKETALQEEPQEQNDEQNAGEDEEKEEIVLDKAAVHEEPPQEQNDEQDAEEDEEKEEIALEEIEGPEEDPAASEGMGEQLEEAGTESGKERQKEQEPEKAGVPEVQRNEAEEEQELESAGEAETEGDPEADIKDDVQSVTDESGQAVPDSNNVQKEIEAEPNQILDGDDLDQLLTEIDMGNDTDTAPEKSAPQESKSLNKGSEGEAKEGVDHGSPGGNLNESGEGVLEGDEKSDGVGEEPEGAGSPNSELAKEIERLEKEMSKEYMAAPEAPLQNNNPETGNQAKEDKNMSGPQKEGAGSD